MNEQISLDDKGSSLLMSEDLYDDVDLDPEATEMVKKRSKIVVFNLIKGTDGAQRDVQLGLLRGLGTTSDDNTTTIEAVIPEDDAVEMLIALRDGRWSLHGVEIHFDENQIDIIKIEETPILIRRCNIYDVTVQSDQVTLVLVMKNRID